MSANVDLLGIVESMGQRLIVEQAFAVGSKGLWIIGADLQCVHRQGQAQQGSCGDKDGAGAGEEEAICIAESIGNCLVLLDAGLAKFRSVIRRIECRGPPLHAIIPATTITAAAALHIPIEARSIRLRDLRCILLQSQHRSTIG